ncbi:MAG: T9SS type A sorting domain-containing protein, partial [Flavobacteriales bacterium]|nr:T9SS type A sorting domain-containing protein [Flavobacteriales bacterium]
SSVSATTYLFGNPYPSALDIHKFIDDNAGVISGTLQLWQQWSGSSHYLNEYNGGYAQVNKLGSCRAFQFVGFYGSNNGSQDGTKTPTKYLPVGQGFIAEIIADGEVVFNNSQRIFIKEADADGMYHNGSTFFKNTNSKSKSSETSSTANDSLAFQKIRLEFNSVSGPETRRELLLGFSEITTDDFDYGYDAESGDNNNNDLNLSFEGKNMNIQAYSPITDDKVIPLNFKSSGNNAFEIKITELENIESSQPIFLRDNLTGDYFDLTQSQVYSFTSEQGKFNNRFEIVFQSESKTLGVEEAKVSENFVYYQNTSKLLFAKKMNGSVSRLALVNMRGQSVMELSDVSQDALNNGIKIPEVSTGTYIAIFRTDDNQVLTKKIIVN